MGKAELFALVGVGDRDVAVGVGEVIDDLFGFVADDEVVRTRVDQIVEDVLHGWGAVHLDEDLRLVVDERAESRSLLGGEDDCLDE